MHVAIAKNSKAAIRMTEATVKQFYPVCRSVLILLARRPLIAHIVVDLMLGILCLVDRASL